MNNIKPYPWLQKRAEMFSAIAESDFKHVKNVDFHFDDPDAGWVDMTIRIDGEVVAELHLSGVWGSDPVADLLRWTERCIEVPNVPHYLYHDGENPEIVFHFEELRFPPDDIDYEHYYATGIFSLFQSGVFDEKHTDGLHYIDDFLYTLCDIRDFRTNLYNAVCDFAERQKTNERAVEDWAWYIYDQKVLSRYKEDEKCDDEEDERLARKMMLKNLKSPIIKRDLQDSRNYRYKDEF